MFGNNTGDSMKDKAKELFDKLCEKLRGLPPKYAALLLCAALILVLIPISIAGSKRAEENDSSSEAEESAEEITDSIDREVPATEESSEPEEDHIRELAGIEKQISERLPEFPGEWCCYMKSMKTGSWFVINDHDLYPASMIKLFAMGACYQKIEDGFITEDEVYSNLYGMEVMSNNQAFNNIVWAIGKTYITEWCHENGYTHTYQNHGLTPSTNAEGLATSDEPNQTCVSDVGHMLEDIYNGTCVSESACERMLDLLFNQHWRTKIPMGIPYDPNVKIGNKTGDTYDVSHDAAIVYTPDGDYVLVLMAEAESISFDLDMYFWEISRLVYDFIYPEHMGG